MLIQIWNETRYWRSMHICVNTYQSPCLFEPPVSLRALEYFLVVPVSFIVVPISFFNDCESKCFFANWTSLFIPVVPNVLTKSVSNVNRTLKLKMYVFKYISDEFGFLERLIKYVLEIVGKSTYGMPFVP